MPWQNHEASVDKEPSVMPAMLRFNFCLPRALRFMALVMLVASPAWAALPLRLALQWQPQSQFAGYYMAVKQGFYRDAGLDVSLLHADIENSAGAMLASKRAEAGSLMLADAIVSVARTKQTGNATALPLVQLTQLFQYSHLTLVAWKDMGITQPGDLDGRPVSLWQGGFSLVFEAFLRKYAASPERIPQYGSIQLFLRRGVAATAAMEYNEVDRLYLAGIDPEQLTVFRMREHGLGLAEDGLYARSEWAAAHPEAARALTQATLKGWDYARQHPEEALDTVLDETRRAGVLTNRAHERWMLKTVLAGIYVAGAPPSAAGQLDPEMYARATRSLIETGLIEQAPAIADFRPPAGKTP